MPDGALVLQPWLAALMVCSALGTAAVLTRIVAPVRRLMQADSERRYATIDGLRGFLAVGVMTHHALITRLFLQNGVWQLPPARLYVHLGQSAVALFFMVSAFLFTHRVLEQGPRIDWLQFLRGRLWRIYPLYLLMLGVMLLTTFAAAGFHLRSSAAALGTAVLDWLLFTLPGVADLNRFPNTPILMAGVVWTLRYEWLFYAALPLLAALLGRSRRVLPALLSGVAVLLLIRCAVWAGAPFDREIAQSFLGGITAAAWVRSPLLVRLARHKAATALAVLALAAVVRGMPTAYAGPSTLGLSVFFIIVASGNSLGGLLHLQPVRWLGEISYSVYLLHGFVLWAVFQRLVPSFVVGPAVNFFLAGIAVAVLVVLVASLTFIGLERPAIACGKRGLSRQARSAPPGTMIEATPPN